MINHARTLLLNLDGPSLPSDLGEEYIPTRFRAVTLTPELTTVRTVLFGSAPDRLYLNYRTAQLMSLLHATEWVSHVLALDPRVTYMPNTQQRFFNALFEPAAYQHNGTPVGVSFLGDNVANDNAGIARNSWLLTFDVEGVATVLRTKNPRTSVDFTFQTANGLTAPIPLHGSRLSVQIGTGGANIGAEGLLGAKFVLEATARPELNVGNIAATLRQLDYTLVNRIFYGDAGAAPDGSLPEPFASFKQLWEQHPVTAYQLCGLLLAVIYRTEAIRNGT